MPTLSQRQIMWFAQSTETKSSAPAVYVYIRVSVVYIFHANVLTCILFAPSVEVAKIYIYLNL